MASISKPASEVRVGDKVWYHGRYWLVTGTTTVDGRTARLHLFNSRTGDSLTWDHPADFDVAIKAHKHERA
ncbi:hypothetical protein [Tsukamurella tyrosinosolvens]|uniref:hypothetical protein n=1 Tax=Tsukamurella tyrosinosolvens TaxID=57704 RepID=UPI00125EA509|nr:hypothetical protein [Tsukamurella tyrosinosolvens]